MPKPYIFRQPILKDNCMDKINSLINNFFQKLASQHTLDGIPDELVEKYLNPKKDGAPLRDENDRFMHSLPISPQDFKSLVNNPDVSTRNLRIFIDMTNSDKSPHKENYLKTILQSNRPDHHKERLCRKLDLHCPDSSADSYDD